MKEAPRLGAPSEQCQRFLLLVSQHETGARSQRVDLSGNPEAADDGGGDTDAHAALAQHREELRGLEQEHIVDSQRTGAAARGSVRRAGAGQHEVAVGPSLVLPEVEDSLQLRVPFDVDGLALQGPTPEDSVGASVRSRRMQLDVEYPGRDALSQVPGLRRPAHQPGDALVEPVALADQP
ncbi:MAG: hypothetical protein ACYCX3_06810, partial [Thermoleophilia bacterium]